MAIIVNKHETTAIYSNGKAYQAVYHIGMIVWQAIRSCFGAGFWNNDKPWLNDEGWNNG